MPTIVQIDGIGQVEFPDDSTPEEIQAHAKGLYRQKDTRAKFSGMGFTEAEIATLSKETPFAAPGVPPRDQTMAEAGLTPERRAWSAAHPMTDAQLAQSYLAPMGRVGKALKAGVADVGLTLTGNPTTENLAVALNPASNEPLPVDVELAGLDTLQGAAAKGVLGIPQTLPALVAGTLGAPIVSPFVSYPAAFGAQTMGETGDPKAAAKSALIAGLFPVVGKMTQPLASAMGAKLVQSGLIKEGSEATLKAVEAGIHQTAFNTAAHLVNLPEYLDATPDERRKMFVETTVANMVFAIPEAMNIPRASVPSGTKNYLTKLVEAELNRKLDDASQPTPPAPYHRGAKPPGYQPVRPREGPPALVPVVGREAGPGEERVTDESILRDVEANQAPISDPNAPIGQVTAPVVRVPRADVQPPPDVLPEAPATPIEPTAEQPAVFVPIGTPMPTVQPGNATFDDPTKGTVVFDPRRISPEAAATVLDAEHARRVPSAGIQPPPGIVDEPPPPAQEPPLREPVKPVAVGAAWTAETPRTQQKARGNWEVVDAGDLLTSEDRGYNQELQERNRDRAASQEQIVRIATSLNPERVSESPTSDLGAPIIDEFNQVLSGNGRTLGIRRAYGGGTERAGAYKQFVQQQGERLGIDPAKIQAMQSPVLVRRVTDYGGMTPVEFARLSNEQQVLGMSVSEKATRAAAMLRGAPAVMDLFRPSEEGDVLAASNREFLAKFIQGTGNVAELLNADGSYNAKALEPRVKNAVLGALLGGENRALLDNLIDRAQTLGVAKAATGVTVAAPRLLKFTGTAYDLGATLHQALSDLVRIRSEGGKVEDFLNQAQMFSDPARTAESDFLLSRLAEARSGKEIAEGLTRYATAAGKIDLTTPDIFGSAPTPRPELLRSTYETKGPTPAQDDFTFGKPPAATPESQGAAGAAGGEPPAKIFADVAAKAALERLKAKARPRGNAMVEHSMAEEGSMPFDENAGTPELADVTAIAGNVIEGGAVAFPDYWKAMDATLGPQFRRYFHDAYNQVREYTEAHGLRERMTPRNEIETYDETGTVRAPAGDGGQPQPAGTVRGAGYQRRPGIRVVDEGDLPAARSVVRAGQYAGRSGAAIDETQRLAINQALTAFESGKPAFLLGDGTGVGKTGTELVIAHQSALRTGRPSLIITESRPIIENNFGPDAEKFGVPLDMIHLATYSDLSTGKIPALPKGVDKWSVVIFDEAHNLKNAGTAREHSSKLLEADHKVFATATPMDSPTHAAYFLAELSGRTTEQVADALGYKLDSKFVNGEARTFAVLKPGRQWTDVLDSIQSLRNRAVQNGQLIRREYPFFGQLNMRDVPAYSDVQVMEQKRIIDYWERLINSMKSPTARRNYAGQKTLELSRWAEIQKLPHVVEAIVEDLARGRRVIVFGEGINETTIKGLGETRPGLLTEVAKELDRRGIQYAKVFEDTPSKKAAAARVFQTNKNVKVLVATAKSGGTGLNLDDIVGDYPRTVHAATMNFSGAVLDQMVGRVSRRNTASPAEFNLWRQAQAFSDQRRQMVLDRKLNVLRGIQTGEDLDTTGFSPTANDMVAEHGMMDAESAASEMSAIEAQAGTVTHGFSSSTTLRQAAAQDVARIRNLVAPQTAGGPARFAGNLLRELNAKMANELARADVALRKFRNDFDRTTLNLRKFTYDPTLPLPRNLAFIDAYETGNTAALAPTDALAAAEFHRLNTADLARVQALGTGALTTFYQNYFPHLWENPKQAASVFSKILGRAPLEGPKSFLKQRTHQLFKEGLEAGLKPVHDNPVDLWLLKKREIERYILAHDFTREMKSAGLMKFKYAFSKAPEGWQTVDDRAFAVYGPPTVTIKEAFDAGMREATLDLLQKLGVPHERLARIGGKRWGYEREISGVPGSERIVTKFAGPDFVIWHELGHVLDHRYPDLRTLIKATPDMETELNALADARVGPKAPASFRKYVRKPPEKMAVVLQAYVHSPDLMEQLAPTVKRALEGFIQAHPELSPINDIRPGLRLGVGETEMSHGGLLKLGDYVMPEAAARVVNNFLSPGLNTHLWYRTLRQTSNLLNGVQLGLSAFHLGFTSLDAATSRLAGGLEDLAHGKPLRALGEVLSVPVSPFTNIRTGAKLRSEVLQPGTHPQMQRLAKALEQAGGRVGQDAFWQTEFTRRMKRAWHEGGLQWATLPLRAPLAAWEQTMRPILEYIVPRQKLGVFADMAKRELLRLGPNASEADTREAMRLAWDSVDNRMGQVVYDNLFYNRAVKDVALLSFRAYGWQLGKYREGIGAVVDTARAAGKVARGETPEFTHRMAYAVALPLMVGTVGGVLHYLLTGQQPQSAQDYFQPQTGELDRNGNPVRLNLPSYVKDVLAYSKHPVTSFGHSLNPLISSMFDLLMNRDFYNVQIRNPDDPLWKQGSDTATFAAQQFVPFSVSGAMKLSDEQAPAWKRVAPYFGFTPVPNRMTMSPSQELASEITAARMPSGATTREKFDAAKMRGEIVDLLRRGQRDAGLAKLQDAVDARALTADNLRVLLEKLRWTPYEFQVHMMSSEDAMRVWRVASPQERATIGRQVGAKILKSRNVTKSRKEILLMELSGR